MNDRATSSGFDHSPRSLLENQIATSGAFSWAPANHAAPMAPSGRRQTVEAWHCANSVSDSKIC